MRFIFTPEFHRNLWTKMSLFKIIAAPIFVGLCMVVLLNIAPEKGPVFNQGDANQFLMEGSWWLFFLVVAVWGIHDTSTALQDEMRNNTWDFQRMSSITPFQLVIGKLFGATSYAWYVGALALLPFWYGLQNAPMPQFWYAYEDAGSPLLVVAFMVLGGLAGQAFAFFVSFVDMTSFAARTGKKRIPRAVLPFSLGVVVAWSVFSVSQQLSPKLSQGSSVFINMTDIEWYGTVYNAPTFIGCSLLVYIAWALLGSYRIARAELMYRGWPVCWMGFVAFLLFYLYGLVDPDTAYFSMRIMGLFMLVLAMTYGVMLFEASDGRRYARFFESIRRGRFLMAVEDVHKWVVTVPFVALMFAMTLANVPVTGQCISYGMIVAFMAALVCFVVRDGLVLHAIIRGSGRNIAFKALFYYVGVYLMLPALQFTLMPKELNFNVLRWMGKAMSCRWHEVELPSFVNALGIYFPLPLPNPLYSLAPVAAQVVLAAVWFAWSLRRRDLRKG